MAGSSNVTLAGPWTSIRVVCDHLHLSPAEVEAKAHRREFQALRFWDTTCASPPGRYCVKDKATRITGVRVDVVDLPVLEGHDRLAAVVVLL